MDGYFTALGLVALAFGIYGAAGRIEDAVRYYTDNINK